MADIVELIAKLELQVGSNEGLEKQIQAFNAQAKAIDELVKKRDLLARGADKDKNAERAARAKVEVDRLTTSIDRQTAALTKQVQQSGVLNKALDEEIGKIQQLTEFIAQATKEQATLTDPKQIKQYSENIRAARAELKALIEPIKQLNNVGAIEALENRIKLLRNTLKTVDASGIKAINQEITKSTLELERLKSIGIETDVKDVGSKSLLSQLLGIGSAEGAGKQVLQGALAGAGIGVGFSVLPAITSSLIEYTSRLLDAKRATFEVSEASRGLVDVFSSQLKGFLDLNRSLNELFGSGQSAYAAAIEQVDALGVVEGETFRFRKQKFEAEQQARQNELAELDQINTKYRELRNALLDYDKVRNLGGLQERLKSIGFSEDELIQINKKIDDIFANLTQKQRERVRLSENDAFASLGAESIARANRIQESILNAEKAFASQTQREIFQLNKQLSIEVKNFSDQIATEELQRRETTAAGIEQILLIQQQQEIRALDRRISEARKQGILTTEISNQFESERAMIVEKYNRQIIEGLRKFAIEQEKIQREINLKLQQEELNALNIRLSLLGNKELGENIALREEIANEQLSITKKRIDAEESEELRSFIRLRGVLQAGTAEYKRNEDEITAIQERAKLRRRNATIQSDNERIANIQKGYADVIRVVKRETDNLNAAIERQNAQALLDISQGEGGIGGRDFQKRLQALRNSRNQAASDEQQAQKELLNAQDALAKANEAVKNAKDETRAAAQEALTLAETNVNKAKTKILAAQKTQVDTTRDMVNMQINLYADMYMQIAQAAQQGYNMIAQYRQQDIDREISVRESRMTAAVELAKMGNTQLLDIETNALKQAQRERRQAALEQQSINAALQFSYAAVAVAKAAAAGNGIFTVATISATVGAIIAGYSAVRSATQLNQLEGFKDGVVDYNGKGTAKSDSNLVRISRGESVMTAEATAANKGVLKMMNAGVPLKNIIPMYLQTGGNMNELKRSVDGVRDEIKDSKINVSQNVDSNGVAQIVTRHKRMEHRKWA